MHRPCIRSHSRGSQKPKVDYFGDLVRRVSFGPCLWSFLNTAFARLEMMCVHVCACVCVCLRIAAPFLRTFVYVNRNHVVLCSSTPQLPFRIPQLPSNRDLKALNRGTLGGLGCVWCFGSLHVSQVQGVCSGIDLRLGEADAFACLGRRGKTLRLLGRTVETLRISTPMVQYF